MRVEVWRLAVNGGPELDSHRDAVFSLWLCVDLFIYILSMFEFFPPTC